MRSLAKLFSVMMIIRRLCCSVTGSISYRSYKFCENKTLKVGQFEQIFGFSSRGTCHCHHINGKVRLNHLNVVKIRKNGAYAICIYNLLFKNKICRHQTSNLHTQKNNRF